MKNSKRSDYDYISGVFSNKKNLLLCIEGLKDFSSFDHQVKLSKAMTGQIPIKYHLKYTKPVKLIRNKEATLTGTLIGSFTGMFMGYAIGSGWAPFFAGFIKFGAVPTSILGFVILGMAGMLLGDWISSKLPEYEIRKFIKKRNPKDILLSVHMNDPKERLQTMELFRILGAKEILPERINYHETSTESPQSKITALPQHFKNIDGSLSVERGKVEHHHSQ